MSERITYITSDDVTIVAEWTAAPTTFGAVILVHMMPADRSSWRTFQSQLARRGLASLAIDLRGHGESTRGPEGIKLDYQSFTDDEHQTSLLDVVGAYEWLMKRGFEPTHIALVGASFGANLAIQMLRQYPRLSGAALLSPGSNYRETSVLEDIPYVLPHQAVWISASEEDDQESFEASQKAFEAADVERKSWVPHRNAGHGTAILLSHPQTAEELADWLRETIQGG